MNSFIDQIEQVDRDLAEIDAQVDAGELDAATAARLRAAYEEERATLLASEAEPPPSDTRRSPQRTLVGGLILGVGVIAIAAFAFVSLQDDSPAAEVSDGVATDVLAGSSGVDLSEVTTEEMEAVVADNPTIVGMRLALAGRERMAAAAGRLGVGVLDRKPTAHEVFLVVDLGALEMPEAHRVDEHLDTLDLDDLIALAALVEDHPVLEAGAAASLHVDPEPALGQVLLLLLENPLHLVGRLRGQRDHARISPVCHE